MSFEKSLFVALAVIGLAGGSTMQGIAAPTGGTGAETRNWRALFHNGNYNQPCPLTVYSEDMSKPVPLRNYARSPVSQSAVQHTTRAASRASQD